MKEEKLTRLKILRVMSYRLLHFLIKEKILSIFLTECLQNSKRISYGIMSRCGGDMHLSIGRSIYGKFK